MLLNIQTQSDAAKHIEGVVDVLPHLISISIAIDSIPTLGDLSEGLCGSYLQICRRADSSSAGSKAGASSRKSLL
jgi:hypothetical protein